MTDRAQQPSALTSGLTALLAMFKVLRAAEVCAATDGQLRSWSIVNASVLPLRPREAREGGLSTRRLVSGRAARACGERTRADLVGVQESRSQVGTFRTVEQYLVVASTALATGVGALGPRWIRGWVVERLPSWSLPPIADAC